MELLRGLVTSGIQRSSLILKRHSLINRIVINSKRNQMNVHSEGKMVVNFLAQEDADRLLVMSYSDLGFRLTNNLFLVGPIVLFPKQLYSWNVKDASRVTPASTSLFYLLVPKVDLIVFGYGDPGNSIPLDTRIFLQSKGINSECLATKDAVATYNYLVDEGRRVAGAFIPPTKIQQTLADDQAILQTGGRHLADISSTTRYELAEQEYIYSEIAKLRLAHNLGKIDEKEMAEKIKEIRKKALRTATEF